MKDIALAALRRASHSVEVIELHGDGFQPVMSAAEWRAYRAEQRAKFVARVQRHLGGW